MRTTRFQNAASEMSSDSSRYIRAVSSRWPTPRWGAGKLASVDPPPCQSAARKAGIRSATSVVIRAVRASTASRVGTRSPARAATAPWTTAFRNSSVAALSRVPRPPSRTERDTRWGMPGESSGGWSAPSAEASRSSAVLPPGNGGRSPCWGLPSLARTAPGASWDAVAANCASGRMRADGSEIPPTSGTGALRAPY